MFSRHSAFGFLIGAALGAGACWFFVSRGETPENVEIAAAPSSAPVADDREQLAEPSSSEPQAASPRVEVSFVAYVVDRTPAKGKNSVFEEVMRVNKSGEFENAGTVFGTARKKLIGESLLEAGAKVKAVGKIVTASGRPGQFIDGGEAPIVTCSGQGPPTVTYKSYGTTVTALPIVLPNGKIHLEFAPLISSINPQNGITDFASHTVIPGFNTQGAQVAVQLESGQTAAIGGMIQHSTGPVPGFSDLPFVGELFRTERYEEHVFLVTVRLLEVNSAR